MLFNSLIFVFFVSAFFALWPLINRLPQNFRLAFILSASLFFYGWWSWQFIFLLLFTGLIDFIGALAIRRFPTHQLFFLVISLLANLGVLVFYKYALFFMRIWADVNGIPTKDLDELSANLFLPIGLSFYTFQSMSYTIDVYRNRMEPTKNPLLFFSFISFFPHLVAGPIVRAREILPQLSRVRFTSETERFHGIKLIILGFFKKTVIADNLAGFVNEAFNGKSFVTGSDYWWIAVLAFTFQIYFDFSGYSDIARGMAKCLGIHFRMNFNHPYGATSFKDFWTKWHISLSYWFRDYVYIGLGGNKKGKVRGHVNMWITMVASGFWHGANYTYLAWGGLHAFFLSLERITKFDKWSKRHLILKVFAILIVFLGCTMAWVFFRAKNMVQAAQIIDQLWSFNSHYIGESSNLCKNAVMFLKIAIIAELLWIGGLRIRKYLNPNIYLIAELFYLAILINCCLFFRGPGEQFIYFQF